MIPAGTDIGRGSGSCLPEGHGPELAGREVRP